MNYGLLECRGSGSHDTKCQAGNCSCTCQVGSYFFIVIFVFLSFFLRFLTASFFTHSVFLSFSSFIFALSLASLINCIDLGLVRWYEGIFFGCLLVGSFLFLSGSGATLFARSMSPKIQKQVDLLIYIRIFYLFLFLHDHIEQKQKPILKQITSTWTLTVPSYSSLLTFFYPAHAFWVKYLSRPWVLPAQLLFFFI